MHENKDLKAIISFAVFNFINLQNETNTQYLKITIDTLNDLNYFNIDIPTIYLLKYIYESNKNIFDIKEKNFLETIFSKCFKQILDSRTKLINQEVSKINNTLECSSNIFNLI